MEVKALRALMLKPLKFGDQVASSATIVSVVEQAGKVLTNITTAQVQGKNVDRMDYKLARKMFSESFTELLKGPGEGGTKGYLEFMRHMHTAYISSKSEPEARIYSALYATFFIREWKFFLQAAVATQERQSDSFHITAQKNFISSNLATCIEINLQALLIFHNKCRDWERPDLFLPFQLNSQGCEDNFRSARSLTSTRSTIVNFDTLEYIQRSNRLIIMEDAPSTLVGFVTTQKKDREMFIPMQEQLLSNQQIRTVALNGSDAVSKTLASFRES